LNGKYYADQYIVLLEGARCVGKTTMAQHFGENQYKSYILIVFSKNEENIMRCFDDIGHLDLFF